MACPSVLEIIGQVCSFVYFAGDQPSALHMLGKCLAAEL